LNSPMAHGASQINPITSPNAPRRWPTPSHPLHSDLKNLAGGARHGITPVAAEYERLATQIADACVHGMQLELSRGGAAGRPRSAPATKCRV
jgi:hypothetical protein